MIPQLKLTCHWLGYRLIVYPRRRLTLSRRRRWMDTGFLRASWGSAPRLCPLIAVLYMRTWVNRSLTDELGKSTIGRENRCGADGSDSGKLAAAKLNSLPKELPFNTRNISAKKEDYITKRLKNSYRNNLHLWFRSEWAWLRVYLKTKNKLRLLS